MAGGWGAGCGVPGSQPEGHDLRGGRGLQLPAVVRFPGNGEGQARATRRLPLPDEFPARAGSAARLHARQLQPALLLVL